MTALRNILGIGMLGLVLAGCAQPKDGALGPQGPAGLNAPSSTVTYSNNFDGAGFVASSQWTALNQNFGGGNLFVSTDSSKFISAGQSLKINSTAGAGVQSLVYSNAGVIPGYGAGDYYIDFYWDISGLVTATENVEVAFVSASSLYAAFGYSTSANNFYTYNGASQYTLTTSPSPSYWHHIKMVAHINFTADYYDNGLLLGQNIPISKSFTFPGAPGTYVGVLMPNSFGADTIRIDNLSLYHY